MRGPKTRDLSRRSTYHHAVLPVGSVALLRSVGWMVLRRSSMEGMDSKLSRWQYSACLADLGSGNAGPGRSVPRVSKVTRQPKHLLCPRSSLTSGYCENSLLTAIGRCTRQ